MRAGVRCPPHRSSSNPARKPRSEASTCCAHALCMQLSWLLSTYRCRQKSARHMRCTLSSSYPAAERTKPRPPCPSILQPSHSLKCARTVSRSTCSAAQFLLISKLRNKPECTSPSIAASTSSRVASCGSGSSTNEYATKFSGSQKSSSNSEESSSSSKSNPEDWVEGYIAPSSSSSMPSECARLMCSHALRVASMRASSLEQSESRLSKEPVHGVISTNSMPTELAEDWIGIMVCWHSIIVPEAWAISTVLFTESRPCSSALNMLQPSPMSAA
mmetsp:Transcript_125030/g.186741  ORF Transcript_125030/g.186741 Transcript_125030/m.186741 type:complete len:274 (-) Transcript_125030:460-1281(-)